MNRQRVLQAFYNYTEKFDGNNLQIGNKKRHTIHVADNSEFIARELRLPECDVDLAWLIGILHDIGRFEQVKRISGYNDKTGFDHAKQGVKILFKDRLIDSFLEVCHEEDIIQCAICNHNRLDLPTHLKDRELLFCNIIRDADKIDNFRGFHENDFLSFHERTFEEVQQSLISDGVMNCFEEHRTIPVEIVKTAADFFLIPYALYFGIVFDCSNQLVENQGHYKRMLDFQFQDKNNISRFEIIKQEITKYIAGRAMQI